VVSTRVIAQAIVLAHRQPSEELMEHAAGVVWEAAQRSPELDNIQGQQHNLAR
jgi:hypothetical protein